MAEEWQVCWECPVDAAHLRSAFMLDHLFVNIWPGMHS